MAAKDELGRAGEERAAVYLTEQGCAVIDRNWRCEQGEIDIVAIDGRDLVVVEVKTRRTLAYGHPLEAIDARKAKRLWCLGMAWIAAHPDSARGRTLRFDAIAVVGDRPEAADVEHLRNALWL